MNKLLFFLILTTLAFGIIAEDKKEQSAIPKLIDLGATKCIPCIKMAPILEELKKEYAGIFDVEFIDVWQKENAKKAEDYKIETIPTQVFLDPKGKELWRHVGFISKKDILAKWKELGFDFKKPQTGAAVPVERMEPLENDDRIKENICNFCDGDINPQTLVTIKTDKGDVRQCSPHCYFIMYTSLTSGLDGLEEKVNFTDWKTGEPVPALKASYLQTAVEKTGRPFIRAFTNLKDAERERTTAGGNIMDFQMLKKKELTARCGFCDRAVYPEDASLVKVAGVDTWGCCAHCALGVAARTGKDIEVHQPDALTGEEIIIKTQNGSVAYTKPEGAVAWFGMIKKKDGTWGSAGCFHQGDFVNVENLKKWLELHPLETGKQISIQQALSDKMKMTPEQIGKACKLGECSPK
jgi:thioredoxin 1